MYNFINVMTIRYKSTASGNIISSTLQAYGTGQHFTATEKKKQAKRQTKNIEQEKCRAQSH